MTVFKNSKAIISIAMTLFLAGCTGNTSTGTATENTEDGELVTLTFFDEGNASKLFTDAVAQQIMEKTGVKIEFESPTGDPNEKLNLMLSGQNYPDLVSLNRGEILNRYTEAGALVPLDDLIEEYGPNIKEMYGDTLTKSRYSDGKVYSLNNWYGKDPDASAGVLIRRDLLAEIVGEERAGSAEFFTQSEYVEILKQFKEKHPEIDGIKTIPVTFNGDTKNYEGALFGMFGMKTYFQDGDFIKHRAKDPRFLELVSFLNDLNGEQLLDTEWQVNKSEQWTQKLSSGSVFSTFGSYWDPEGANSALRDSVGEDAQFYSYKIVADDLDTTETTYNGRNSLGWTGIAITKNNDNVEATMKFIDYLVSEEGQYLMLWGIEDEHWKMEDGKRTPDPEILKSFKEDWNTVSNETGIRKWAWFIKNGVGSDGSPYDMPTKYEKDDITIFANESFGDSDYWDSAEFSGLEPQGNSPLSLKWQKVTDIYDQSFGSLVSAPSKNELHKSYEEMLKKMSDAGLEEAEEFITTGYKERMKIWDN